MAQHTLARIVTKNLLLHYDPINPKGYSGSGNTLLSIVNGSNHSGKMNGISDLIYSSTNGAVEFNNVNSVIVVSSTMNLAINETFTVDFFLAPANSIVHMVFAYDITGDNNTIFRLERSNQPTDGLEFGHFAANGTLYELVGTGFSQNAWSHCAVTYDGNTKTMYKNGEFFSQAISQELDYTRGLTAKFAFGGRYGNGGNNNFVGKMANMKIYDRALTPEEIRQNFNAHRGRFNL